MTLPSSLHLHPRWALPGGRVTITGSSLPIALDGPPRVRIGEAEARVVSASPRAIRVLVPPLAEAGRLAVRIGDGDHADLHVEVARTIATDVHHVDSPLFDRAGRLYLTQSGSRDTRAPVPLYRVGLDGVRESLAVEIANPTSLALGPDGAVYISSRFDGHVYRLTAEDRAEIYATELGVATGLAFAPDGTLFVGDRSGQILRVSPEKRVDNFATLPSSVAAFHLAYGPDDCLYVTAPTLATHDTVYRITPDRLVDVVTSDFGRPQGLAFDARGRLHVVEALAGAAGLFRLDSTTRTTPVRQPTLLVSAPALVGVAFGPSGRTILASNDTVWEFDAVPDDDSASAT